MRYQNSQKWKGESNFKRKSVNCHGRPFRSEVRHKRLTIQKLHKDKIGSKHLRQPCAKRKTSTLKPCLDKWVSVSGQRQLWADLSLKLNPVLEGGAEFQAEFPGGNVDLILLLGENNLQM